MWCARVVGTLVIGGGVAGCGRTSVWEAPPSIVDPCDVGQGDDACVSFSTLRRAVDILFVIDNSGSMGVEQGKLAANFPAFIGVLEGQPFGASYRIGLSTTGASGALRVSSCRERLPEFIFENEDVFTDEQQAGCLASCAYDRVSTVPGPDGVARPWLEKDGAVSNLADGVSMADAMRCVGPQGINGSGIEAPMESMVQVLAGEGNSAGFSRDDALLAIVFVTDETDCSMSAEHKDILYTGAASALWTDPERVTSGACWTAGTTCTGGPGRYDDCFAVDKGFDGQPIEDGEPVLYPVDRYVDALNDHVATKAARGGTGQVLVAVIGGVPLDYPQTGVMRFEDSEDPEFNTEFGIGPACGRGTETPTSPPGIPPVRLAEFAEQFAAEERNLFSICADDYTVALSEIVEALGRLSARTCVPGCVADRDPDDPGLQPACHLVERDATGGERVVPRCLVTTEGWSFPSTSPTLCHRALLDGDGSTSTRADDLSQQCATRGANVEFVVERPEGVFEPAGTSVEVECDLTAPVGTPCEG